MKHRIALSLLTISCGALLTRCGGGGPSGPTSPSGPAASGIPVLAHYVSWHTVPGQWADAPWLPLRSDNPAGGYTSANPAIIAQHNAEMEANGIWPMVSWWGPDPYAGDKFLNQFLTASGPPLGILYEAVGEGRLAEDAYLGVDFTDSSVVAQFIAEMEHLRDRYFNGPSGGRFIRIDGRPLVFIWVSHAFRGPFETAAAQVRQYAYLVGSEYTVPAAITPGHEPVIRGLDAVTSYGFYDSDRYPEQMDDRFIGDYGTAIRVWREKLSAISPDREIKLLLPMGFAYDERGIPGRRGFHFSSSAQVAERYARIVRSYATNPPVPGVLPMAWLTSYNEHYEGSAVEPNRDPDRPDYLGIVRNVFMTPGP